MKQVSLIAILIVLPGAVVAQSPKYVYLTFDDGPLAGTDDCIAVLSGEAVKGTFFMVGAHMTTSFRKDQVKAVKANEFLQANHSNGHWHQASNYSDPGKTNSEWLNDFKKCDAATASIREDSNGTIYRHARLPGKNAWRVSDIVVDDGNSKRVADHLHSNGYLIFGWDVEWKYSGTAAASDPIGSPTEIANKVVTALDNGGTKKEGKVVVLLHDHQFRTSRNNKDKLKQLIQALKQKIPDAQFRTVETYATD